MTDTANISCEAAIAQGLEGLCTSAGWMTWELAKSISREIHERKLAEISSARAHANAMRRAAIQRGYTGEDFDDSTVVGHDGFANGF